MRRFSDLAKPIFRFVRHLFVCLCYQKHFEVRLYDSFSHSHSVFCSPLCFERSSRKHPRKRSISTCSPIFGCTNRKGGFRMYYTFLCIMYLIIDSLFALLTAALCINKMLKIGKKSNSHSRSLRYVVCCVCTVCKAEPWGRLA